MGSTVPLSVLASKASSARVFANFLIRTSLSTTTFSPEVADDGAPDACCDAAHGGDDSGGPTLGAGVPLPVLLLAVPPTVHTLPEPMGHVATLPVGPTQSLVLVPVPLIAVGACAPVLGLEIAVPTPIRATATSTAVTSAAGAAASAAVAAASAPVAAAAPAAVAAAAAVADGPVGAAFPPCMYSRGSV